MKVAITSWLLGRAHSLGNRHIKLAKGVSSSFAVEWAATGAFTFAQVGTEVRVRHSVLGAAALPGTLDFRDGDGWEILDNHDDEQARNDYGIAKVHLKNIFRQSETDKMLWAQFTPKAARESGKVHAQYGEHASMVPTTQACCARRRRGHLDRRRRRP